MHTWIYENVQFPDIHFQNEAKKRQAQLTKPPGSLGQLEEISIKLSGLLRCEKPLINTIQISIFAADHGIVSEGVSAFPQIVTAEMIKNFSRGGAAISILSKHLGANFEVINLGTVAYLNDKLPNVVNNIIADQTANFLHQPAMSNEQFEKALMYGKLAAKRAHDTSAKLFIGGDMGIGNTTSSAALYSSLLDLPPEVTCGPGTGLDSKGVNHKSYIVSQALGHHGADHEPAELLRLYGGFEITALCGAYIHCAQLGIPILVDGFITTSAALVACKIQPKISEWLFFSHQSAEPAHIHALNALNAQPLLNLGMHLGEGSGAAVCVPILQAACALHNEMATFEEASVSQ